MNLKHLPRADARPVRHRLAIQEDPARIELQGADLRARKCEIRPKKPADVPPACLILFCDCDRDVVQHEDTVAFLRGLFNKNGSKEAINDAFAFILHIFCIDNKCIFA